MLLFVCVVCCVLFVFVIVSRLSFGVCCLSSFVVVVWCVCRLSCVCCLLCMLVICRVLPVVGWSSCVVISVCCVVRSGWWLLRVVYGLLFVVSCVVYSLFVS